MQDSGDNTVVVDGGSVTTTNSATTNDIKNEVFRNGPAVVSFSASNEFDAIGEGDIYSGSQPDVFTTIKYATILGWQPTDEAGESVDWIIMYSNSEWGDEGLGKISSSAAEFTLYSASAQWAARPGAVPDQKKLIK
jgi:hypothetical protein